MSLEIGPHVFDYVSYDDESDILFGSKGQPQPTAGKPTPEGHTLNFTDDNQLVSVDLLNARLVLKRDGELRVTLPDGKTYEVAGAAAAIKQPA